MLSSGDSPAVDTPSRWGRVIVASGVIATLVGLALHGTWRELPAERFLLSLVIAGIVALLAWPLRRGLGWSAASAFAAIWSALLVVFVGPLPLLATGVLGTAAWAVGLALVPREASARGSIAIVVGLIVIAMAAGWTLALPIHHRPVWLVALALPILLQHRALRAEFLAMRAAWRGAVAGAPRSAGATTLLVGLASVACWVPAMQADDLAYHLALPASLLNDGVYAPDAEYQKWAFAPWAGDTLHGIVGILAGRETFGALNALWIVLGAALIGGPLARARADTDPERWMAVALFATFPPLVWMAAGLQTELPATATLLAFAALALAPMSPALLDRAWLAGSLLFTGLFALKLIHGVAALPLLAVALWRFREARWPRIAGPVLLVGALGASSYVGAWIATGNPVLPLLNEVFESPYAPSAAYIDARWHAGFGIDLPWRMTFETASYVEGWDGGLGFTLVALAVLWGVRIIRGPDATLLVAATLVVLLPLIPMQYARYAWPGLVLWATLLCFGAQRGLGGRPFRTLFIGLCVLNLAYQANASWIHHSAAVKRTIRSGGEADAVLPHYVPERMLLRHVGKGADDLVLASDPERNVVAELGGRGRTVSAHDPSLALAAVHANAEASGESWAALLRRERIRWVLVSRPVVTPALEAGLARLGAERVASLDGRELWRLPD